MAVKYVEEHFEEMCTICLNHTFGVFVEKGGEKICRDCCEDISKQLRNYEMENK